MQAESTRSLVRILAGSTFAVAVCLIVFARSKDALAHVMAAVPWCFIAANILYAEYTGTIRWRGQRMIDRDSSPTDFYNNLLLAVLLYAGGATVWSVAILYHS